MRYFVFITLALLTLGGVLAWWGLFPVGPEILPDPVPTEPVASEPIPPEPVPEPEVVDPDPTVSEPELPDMVIRTVPFTPQAPSSQWGDPVFQNACEEASLIMAAAWAVSEDALPPKDVIEERIRSMSSLAEKRFGTRAYDTSAEDTATLYREYFRSDAVSVVHDPTLDDLKDILREGNIVVAPFDGRLLGNPHYTPPGPEYHMLVIVGYDAVTREFVTNDPGTRHGAGYRYAEDVLFGAMADYPTGHHLPRSPVVRRSVIVISLAASSDDGFADTETDTR